MASIFPLVFIARALLSCVPRHVGRNLALFRHQSSPLVRQSVLRRSRGLWTCPRRKRCSIARYIPGQDSCTSCSPGPSSRMHRLPPGLLCTQAQWFSIPSLTDLVLRHHRLSSWFVRSLRERRETTNHFPVLLRKDRLWDLTLAMS
jgi:hypothetical protein